MATPLLIVTDVGLAIASTATPTGPYIHIVGFKLGSAYGYEANRSDTSLNGNILFEGVPSAYQNVGDNTIDIICRLPPAAGPFEYGELGLYVEDSNGDEVLFAKAVWDYPQTKSSSLGTNVNSQSTFHCLLKLQQSIAVFKVDVTQQVAVWEVDKWSDVIVPSLSANPEVPLVLVRELDQFNNSSLLQTSQPLQDEWTVGTNYERLIQSTTVGANLSSITIGSGIPAWKFASYQDRQFVVEIAGLNSPFRSVGAVAVVGSNLRLDLNPDPLPEIPANGTQVTVYENVNYPRVTLGDRTNLGIVRAGNGIAVPSAGVFEAYGLLHGAPGTGRELTSSDTVDDWTLPSGEYNVNTGSRPSGLPTTTYAGGRFRQSHFQNHVCQEFFPWWNTGDPGGGINGYPYWRMYSINLNQWTPWRKVGSTSGEGGWISLPRTSTAPSRGILVVQFPSGPKETNLYVYVNGLFVGHNGTEIQTQNCTQSR